MRGGDDATGMLRIASWEGKGSEGKGSYAKGRQEASGMLGSSYPLVGQHQPNVQFCNKLASYH